MAPDTHELEETEGGFPAGATAEMLRHSPRTLRRAIGRGELLAIERAGVLYINPDDLIEYRARATNRRYVYRGQDQPFL